VDHPSVTAIAMAITVTDVEIGSKVVKLKDQGGEGDRVFVREGKEKAREKERMHFLSERRRGKDGQLLPSETKGQSDSLGSDLGHKVAQIWPGPDGIVYRPSDVRRSKQRTPHGDDSICDSRVQSHQSFDVHTYPIVQAMLESRRQVHLVMQDSCQGGYL